MLVTGDRSYINVVENTFNTGPKTWRPKPGLNAGDWVGAAVHAGTQWVANQANPPLPGGGHLVPGWADPGQVFIGDIAAFNTNFLDEFYDDDGWWALAWIKAYDLTQDNKYLAQAETIFTEMAGGVDGYCGGGIYWQKNKESSDNTPNYKNAIANELFLAVAASLYVRLNLINSPNAQTYLSAANTEWNWFQASGLINVGNMVNDSFSKSSSGWTCKNDQSQAVWTYNQGVILGALCELCAAVNARQFVKNFQLLDTAERIADALISHPVGQLVSPATPGGPYPYSTSNVSGVNAANGVLTEWNDSDYSNADPDNKQFKGIFVRNLGYLYKLRPMARYRAFIQKNANSILDPAVGVENGSNQFGGNWSAPFDLADFVRQTAAVDLLERGERHPPQVNYTSPQAIFVGQRRFSLGRCAGNAERRRFARKRDAHLRATSLTPLKKRGFHRGALGRWRVTRWAGILPIRFNLPPMKAATPHEELPRMVSSLRPSVSWSRAALARLIWPLRAAAMTDPATMLALSAACYAMAALPGTNMPGPVPPGPLFAQTAPPYTIPTRQRPVDGGSRSRRSSLEAFADLCASGQKRLSIVYWVAADPIGRGRGQPAPFLAAVNFGDTLQTAVESAFVRANAAASCLGAIKPSKTVRAGLGWIALSAEDDPPRRPSG